MDRLRSLAVAVALTTLPLSLFGAPSPAPASAQKEAAQFLTLINASYQALYKVNSEAQWKAVTDVTSAHDAALEAAGKAYAAFNGNPAVITQARALLQHPAHRARAQSGAAERGRRSDDQSASR